MPMKAVKEAGIVIIAGSALGWVLNFLLPIFFSNSTGQIQNATMSNMVNNNTVPLIFFVVSLAVGILLLINAVKTGR